MQQIRLGMIGCGYISHAHGRASRKTNKNIRFVACASRDPEAVKAWADAYGCDRSYTDYREMLRYEQLDGVVIATWPNVHREQIEEAIAAGVRFILCEKSLAVSGNDALAIWDIANKEGACVVEAFMYRHHEAIACVDRLVAPAEIGKIDCIHGAFHMFDAEDDAADDAKRTWRHRAEAGGGVLHDFICYPVDAANKYAGAPPIRASAFGTTSEKFGVINRLFALVEYQNGCVASLESSRKAAFRQSLRIAGSRAIIDLPTAWSIRDDVTVTKTTIPAFLVEQQSQFPIKSGAHDGTLTDFPIFTLQLESFAEAIVGVRSPIISLSESVVNALTLDAIGESFRTGAQVEIAIPQRILDAKEGGEANA